MDTIVVVFNKDSSTLVKDANLVIGELIKLGKTTSIRIEMVSGFTFEGLTEILRREESEVPRSIHSNRS